MKARGGTRCLQAAGTHDPPPTAVRYAGRVDAELMVELSQLNRVSNGLTDKDFFETRCLACGLHNPETGAGRQHLSS